MKHTADNSLWPFWDGEKVTLSKVVGDLQIVIKKKVTLNHLARTDTHFCNQDLNQLTTILDTFGKQNLWKNGTFGD